MSRKNRRGPYFQPTKQQQAQEAMQQQTSPAAAAASSSGPVRIPVSAPIPPAQPEPEPEDDMPDGLAAKLAGRTPFGTRELKLDVEPIPGYVQRWFNDTPGRIERAKRAGYEHVLEREGRDDEPKSRSVGTSEGGGGIRAYLMKIPEEFYNADFAAKMGALDTLDAEVMRGKHNVESGDGTYVPRDRSTGKSVIKRAVRRSG